MSHVRHLVRRGVASPGVMSFGDSPDGDGERLDRVGDIVLQSRIIKSKIGKTMKKLLSLLSALCLFSTVMAAEEYVRVQCPLGTTVTTLTLGVPVSYKVSIYADSGVKSVKWAGLPSGLKYNAKTGNIEGAASRAGTFTPKLAIVTNARNKYTSSPNAITVASFEKELVGSYKGGIFFLDTKGIGADFGYLVMKIAANGKCSGAYNALFPKKKKIAIVSGHFTDPQRKNSYFDLKLKDGRTINLEYGQGVFGSKYLGHFIERSSDASKYEVNIAQDPFARADTKAFAKSLVGRKMILKNSQLSQFYGDYELTVTSSGKVSVKGTWDSNDGTQHKVSLSGGFLIPSLWCTSSTIYFFAYIPWPAENDMWLEYVKCTSSGTWSWWDYWNF